MVWKRIDFPLFHENVLCDLLVVSCGAVPKWHFCTIRASWRAHRCSMLDNRSSTSRGPTAHCQVAPTNPASGSSVQRAWLNFRRPPILCTTLYRNPVQASNFGGTFDQLFLWIFLWNFHRRCLSTFSIQKSQKWPKTQIKGLSCLK